MRPIGTSVGGAVICIALMATASSAQAAFNLMQIEQVLGGVNGDTTVQAIQLRMRANHQSDISQARVRVWDANGANAVLIIDMSRNAFNHNLGDRVLIGSPNFVTATVPDSIPDFVMTNVIPESYLAAGSLTFESDTGVVYWRLSWGGSKYHGSTMGDTANDDDPGTAQADFGPPFAGGLPSTTWQALRFTRAAFDLSTTNANDYALTDTTAIFTNNAREEFTLSEPEPMPGDINNDGDVGMDDYAICAACMAGPADFSPPLPCTADDFAACDIKPDDRVDLADFADFTLLFTGF